MAARYFKPSEFACHCGCGTNDPDPALVAKLDDARGRAGIPFKVASGCRCERHNAAVGGSAGSSHVPRAGKPSTAADIVAIASHTRWLVITACIDAGFTRIEVAPTWIHVDCDPDKPPEVIWLG